MSMRSKNSGLSYASVVTLLAAGLSLAALSACTKSSTDAVTLGLSEGASATTAVTFIPVHNRFASQPTEAQLQDPGIRTAWKIAQMVQFAYVECQPLKSLSANGWVYKLESAAVLGKVFLSTDRKIVLESSVKDGPDEETPCTVFPGRLISYPVAKAFFDTIREHGAATQDALATAQFFYLAMKGYEPADLSDDGQADPSALFLEYARLAEESGLEKKTATEIVDELQELDPDLNPCSQLPPRAVVKGDARHWRDDNFTCFDIDASGKVKGYAPRVSGDFAKLRDRMLTKIALFHDFVFDRAWAMSTKRQLLWSTVTYSGNLNDLASGKPEAGVAKLLLGQASDIAWSDFAAGDEEDPEPILKAIDLSADGAPSLGLADAATMSFDEFAKLFPPSRRSQSSSSARQAYQNVLRRYYDQVVAKKASADSTNGFLRKAALAAKSGSRDPSPNTLVNGQPTIKGGRTAKSFSDLPSSVRSDLNRQLSSSNINQLERDAEDLRRSPKSTRDGVILNEKAQITAQELANLKAIATFKGDKDMLARLNRISMPSGTSVPNMVVDGTGGGRNNDEYMRLRSKDGGTYSFIEGKTTQTWVPLEDKSAVSDVLTTARAGGDNLSADTKVRVHLEGTTIRDDQGKITAGTLSVFDQNGGEQKGGMVARGHTAVLDTTTSDGHWSNTTSAKNQEAVLNATKQALQDISADQKKLCADVTSYTNQRASIETDLKTLKTDRDRELAKLDGDARTEAEAKYTRQENDLNAKLDDVKDDIADAQAQNTKLVQEAKSVTQIAEETYVGLQSNDHTGQLSGNVKPEAKDELNAVNDLMTQITSRPCSTSGAGPLPTSFALDGEGDCGLTADTGAGATTTDATAAAATAASSTDSKSDTAGTTDVTTPPSGQITSTNPAVDATDLLTASDGSSVLNTLPDPKTTEGSAVAAASSATTPTDASSPIGGAPMTSTSDPSSGTLASIEQASGTTSDATGGFGDVLASSSGSPSLDGALSPIEQQADAQLYSAGWTDLTTQSAAGSESQIAQTSEAGAPTESTDYTAYALAPLMRAH